MPSTKEEENLKRLIRTPLASNFVKRKNGRWDHHEWLDFLAHLKKSGYDPIDQNKVGLLLEEKKAQYFASQSA